ncbi:MAG TPA: aromatic/alkene monooxygenase hydroxylase subunit beta [Noviherbaspirillum sp.]|uniref:aromatic/alkene monooxygenase hydroxylase subunit beta n=1 Tax=Noviherbaspirillum sp. TaxID=1926288 RepID=UPI002B48D248|nr:aromatic/alkene monooxygenase hydroxylase subunit beta [Noviherbaspirillum sp.]HJV87924.1 aromatic/alkene monooxygenase hydroxylase subunit beta [Noviherbaspirillum sp.]
MHIDLRTVSIKPMRQTFDNVARRIGGDKPASRYQEGTLGVQADANFHYRPLWDPDHELFDVTRTRVKMADWYAFKDPRQLYYGTYTLARARMQETAEGDFDFVESRGLASALPEATRKLALDVLLPLRHQEWGANMNNAFICAYGYGTAITQPCIYQAMDHLGIAQYLTRAGLLLEDETALDAAKDAWLNNATWQGLRRYVEDSFVVKDWFELFVAQNLVLDGLLYPLVYQHIDNALCAQAGPTISMLTRFQTEWFAETRKWVDASIKTAAAESADNKALLSQWTTQYRDKAIAALLPLAKHALGEQAEAVMTELKEEFNIRATKAGLAL